MTIIKESELTKDETYIYYGGYYGLKESDAVLAYRNKTAEGRILFSIALTKQNEIGASSCTVEAINCRESLEVIFSNPELTKLHEENYLPIFRAQGDVKTQSLNILEPLLQAIRQRHEQVE